MTLPTTSSYDYGPGEHPVWAFTLVTEGAAVNWARLHGLDRYADDVDFDQVGAFGPRLEITRSLEADSDATAEAYAAAALTRDVALRPAGRLRAPANVGQEMFDVVTVDHPDLGVDQDFRVVGLRYIFDRATTSSAERPTRFDMDLDLAFVEES